MASGLQQNIRLVAREVVFRRFFVVLFFAVVSSALIMLGANWPKSYTSSTTIFVEEENIIGPLMEGAAVQTEVVDRAAIAREIIYGNKIMTQLLELEGLLKDNPDPVIQDRMIDDIKGSVNITNVRRNLIRIEFSDKNPERAFRITRNLAQLFIDASHAAKAQQSTEAFEFIDNQAHEYKVKLQEAEQALKLFRSENVDAQPGVSGEMGRRTNELQTRKEQITQELREAQIRKQSLQKQLSGEAQASTAFSRSEQYKTRIAELQGQLDNLRLSYHETYPDIVQIKEQIADLRKAVKEAEATQRDEIANHQEIVIDERVLGNPVYQQLQRELYDTNTVIQTLNARLDQTNAAIQQQIERARKVEEYEARLQELTRDYEVNHETYSDLMRRREQARVSMNLDKERKGLNLRIDEPAFFPHSPSGFQFIHFLLAGPVLGLVIPVGILFVLVQLDPRIRDKSTIYDNMGIPVIGEIPQLNTPVQERIQTLGVIGVMLIFLAALAFIVTMGYLKTQGPY